MRNSIPILNPNSKNLDYCNYIVRVSVEPLESVLLLRRLAPPPVSEQELTLVIAGELASLHRQLASVSRRQRQRLALTFADLAANSIVPTASSPVEPVRPAFSLARQILPLVVN